MLFEPQMLPWAIFLGDLKKIPSKPPKSFVDERFINPFLDLFITIKSLKVNISFYLNKISILILALNPLQNALFTAQTHEIKTRRG